MKKLYSVFCITIITIFLSNLLSIQQQHENIPKFKVLESTPSQTVLEFTLPDFSITTEELNGINYDRIDIECDGTTFELGLPELPIYSTLVAIPYHGSVSMELLSQDNNTIANYSAKPVQDKTRSFNFNSDYYNGDIVYPTRAITLSEPGIIRDFRIVSVSITPFVYNPITRSLEITENLTCRLNYSNENGINEMEIPEMYSPSFEPIYHSLITNYEQFVDRTIPIHNKRLLIIYGNSSAQQYLDKLDEFVRWKKQKGYQVTTTSTSDVGSNTTDIKNYIQTLYNNIYTRPEYVLLIGDTTGSVHIDCYTVGGGASDYPFTQLSGTDIMGDVFIGRMPVESGLHFLTMANIVFTYERDTVIEPTNWYNQMLLVGDTGCEFGQQALDISKYLKFKALQVNPDYNFTEYYSSNQTGITASINSGVSIFLNSGSLDGMRFYFISNESSYTNSYRMPHCILNQNLTGNFNSTDDSDSFVRFGSPAMPKGGITAIGMSTGAPNNTIGTSLTGGIIDGIFSQGMRDMSSSLLLGKLQSMYYNDIIPSFVTNFTSWFNLMGDPTVEVFIGTPGTLAVQYPATINPEDTIYPVYVEDAEGNPLEGAVVTLVNDEFQVITETDYFGNALGTLPEGLVENDVFTVTVSKHDFVPIFEDIPVSNVDGILISDIVYDDSLNGNNDGATDAGEAVYLSISLTNPGTTNIINAEVELTTQDSYISILQNSCNYGDINPGAIAVCNSAYEIQIDVNTPDMYQAIMKLQVVGEEYSTHFSIQLNNADIYLESVQLQNANPVLEAGQTVDFSISLVNNGGNDIEGVQVELSTGSTLISFPDGYAYYGAVVSGGTVSNITDALTVSTDDLMFAGAHIEVTAHIFSDNGFNEDKTFIFLTGEPTIDGPSGPDRFGHYIYHSSDINNITEAEYNWIEISPAEGGLGTEFTSIIDGISGSQNNDVDFADTVDNTTLPFTFTFYGLYYSEVYISSNGYLTFNPIESGGPHNMPIPGIMSPNPVIAPFWDNLEFHNGSGIFHWFDSVNHRFIIEWYNAYNSFDSSSEETFEVILYDPEFYPTSTGDGMVKMQYQVFNDVNSPNMNAYPPLLDLYSTIGFGDHTNTDGITYLFNQNYTEAGQQITNGTSLLISGEHNLASTPVVPNNTPVYSAVLHPNYPNPFNPVTNISYSLSQNGSVSLDIYNIRGQHIRNLVKDTQNSGNHTVQWNGKDDKGHECASGLYLYRLWTNGSVQINKAMLLK